MSTYEFGDIIDLQSRLASVGDDTDRRLVPIFGAGLSAQVVPGVATLIDLFRAAMPRSGRARFDERIGPLGQTGLAYQNAASLLKNQAGNDAVSRVIRKAVLAARTEAPIFPDATVKDVDQCRALEQDENWRVPAGHLLFAEYFAALDGSKRGPVITTNFDPLIEISMRRAGIDAAPIPIGNDVAPSRDLIDASGRLPVYHIHGYWTSSLTLNTITQLTGSRPNLTNLLRHTLQNAVILVVGYSGWEDALVKSLADELRDSSAINSEILWASYSERLDLEEANEHLRSILRCPEVTIYTGIDANLLFKFPKAELIGSVGSTTTSPFGYTRLPADAASAFDPNTFREGSQPAWSDAEPGRWPKLAATQELERVTRDCLDSDKKGAVAIGPLGEGKSLAIRQVALDFARDNPGWTVLWREPGAPTVTAEWIEELSSQYEKVLVCVDEADLVVQSISSTRHLWDDKKYHIRWLLASHDRLWWKYGKTLAEVVEPVLFHGLSGQDAKNIADAWEQYGLIGRTQSEEYRKRLLESAYQLKDVDSGTLYGAILDVVNPTGFADRTRELLNRLAGKKVSGSERTLEDIFVVICVLQHYCDRFGDQGAGATRNFLAEFLDIPHVFADVKAVRMLGKEAAISFAGDCIYARHPAIARSVIDELVATQRLAGYCQAISKVGGRLRLVGALPEREYRGAYGLARVLSSEVDARAAALGAIEGAVGLLEPRVSMCAVLRRFSSAKMSEYSHRLGSDLAKFIDFGPSVRGYLNELALVSLKEGEASNAMGFAALGLDDEVGRALDRSRASYLLVTLTKGSVEVRNQTGRDFAVPEVCYSLLERIDPSSLKFLSNLRDQIGDTVEVRRSRPEQLLFGVMAEMNQAVKGALRSQPIDVTYSGHLSLQTLQHLCASRST